MKEERGSLGMFQADLDSYYLQDYFEPTSVGVKQEDLLDVSTLHCPSDMSLDKQNQMSCPAILYRYH